MVFGNDHIRQCPYCRAKGGYLPLPLGHEPLENIHTEFKPKNHQTLYNCSHYLKSQLKMIANNLNISIRDKYGKIKSKHILFNDISTYLKEEF